LRDASAGAIMASALLELSKYADSETSAYYFSNAETIITSLSKPPYRTALGEGHNFLLIHSVGHLPGKSEIDCATQLCRLLLLEAMKRYKEYKKK
jgi:hypothetical protein